MPFFSTSQKQFHYTEQPGLGHVTLMLHSTGTGSWQWKQYQKCMPSRHMLALDFLGYSPSDSWAIQDSINIDFEAAEHLLLQQHTSIDIIGHSYGGFLAMKLAMKHPKKIRALLLHEPVAWGALFDGKRDDLTSDFEKICDVFFRHQEDIDIDAWLEYFIGYWNEPNTWTQLPEKTKSIWRHRFHKIYSEVSYLCLDRTPLEYWSTLKASTTITLSTGAPAHEQEVCHLLASIIPNSNLIQHKGGHLSPLTHFSELSPIILDWAQL
jgi:pimeloyl-ACP methyl ester carboxylesterase